MIKYKSFVLDNGLQVLVHEDHSSEMAVVNLLYKVGSRNEVSGKTGLAHYFEHLMFSGTEHIPEFDSAIERVGGECNAFTNTDITNFYITLPAINLDTALWLEADRMRFLNLKEKPINTQKQVVIEEFKQRYLNQPYGDAMHHVRQLAFTKHPYRWPTIGEKIEDIERFEREELLAFYEENYTPNNAILCIAGKVNFEDVKARVHYWFDDIPKGKQSQKTIVAEPIQKTIRRKQVFSTIPTEALYKVYKMPGRLENNYLTCDLISDILGFGRSALLEKTLIKNSSLFANCQSYVLGNIDPGLMVITGKMEKGVAAEDAEAELDEVLENFKKEPIPQRDLQKIKNQAQAMQTYESVSLLGRAMKLAYYAYLGDTQLMNKEFERKIAITVEEIQQATNTYLNQDLASVIYYKCSPND
ncbi:M16 family metallopeptidase [Cyclobacterium amurskyense]|uniref:Peptidase M16 domain protein n=1 Tax=Cyclobacterium amurskyense TaxID=320787 RepID=A0A0H4PC50_9BACT|nr:pitrilysin family protein [Cyclobacterium amurskyense]AKP50710.1 Peptidase M16 domain protein [Cyclobacterium amurskyense]|tara:strand:+ start:1894 stop:3138 length:1245 start_codon:yes stop_codon:yes gene_type:complete